MRLWPGSPFPLGATYDGVGTNFAIYSEPAELVESCLFDDDDSESRVSLTEMAAWVWHGYAPNVGRGQRYGYRVHGPYDGARGLRCKASKLLLDPYALPAKRWGAAWLRILDTADSFNEGEAVDAGKATTVDARSLAVHRRMG